MDNIEIYSNPGDLTEGIFGQCLIWLLEVLYTLKTNNTIKSNTPVVFNINTLNNGNLIPTFIQPKNIYDTPIEPKKISLTQYKNKNKMNSFELNSNGFKSANKIFNKYFKFNDFIINEVKKLNISHKTLGIHFRGTDKNYNNSSEANYITKEEMTLIIQDYMTNKDVEQIFCCSDEQSFVNKIKRLYPNKVIEYKQTRADNSNNLGLHKQGRNSNDSVRDNLTYSCIIDMLGLSNCSTVIKSSSALSSFSKIINPSLTLYTVSAMKYPWFPTAVAEQYESKSEEIRNILKRTMKGDYYNELHNTIEEFKPRVHCRKKPRVHCRKKKRNWMVMVFIIIILLYVLLIVYR